MTNARASALLDSDPAATARLHSVLRFAAGTSAAFVLSEAMGWYPTLFPPLLAGMLLANLPSALPMKAGLALILVQTVGAFAAFLSASLLNETPIVLFGLIGLIIFTCFAALAQGRGMLPILLILISFATIPVVTMVAPQQAGALPLAFSRSMVVAVIVVWVVHVVWPETREAPSPPAPVHQIATPLVMAVAGLAIVLPLMLFYLMYGITDALPVLITTVVLVTNFDPRRGAMQGAAMVLGNLIGGIVAIFAYSLLQLAPDLATLFLITFLIGIVFAMRIERGGPGGAVALVTFNQAVVMFSLALVPGGADPGLWVTRLLQFGVAGIFAIGMMTLLLPRGTAAGDPEGPEV